MMMMIIQESNVENNAVELKAEDDVLLEVQQGDEVCIYYTSLNILIRNMIVESSFILFITLFCKQVQYVVAVVCPASKPRASPTRRAKKRTKFFFEISKSDIW